MKMNIGFVCEQQEKKPEAPAELPRAAMPKRSVVRVQFPGKGAALTYYNDRFDLRVGDLVYVDGKLEGARGRVTEVNYNFKIKPSEYKRVIAVVDTTVRGQLSFAGSHFVAFDREVIPAMKISAWFKAPAQEGEEEFVCGNDDTSFSLHDLKSMQVTPAVAERGHGYYMNNKVVYLCLDGEKGYAIVEGSEAYEVEFVHHNGEISRLTCTCFCSEACKHEFAAMLQLQELLDRIEKHYAAEYARTGYFAALVKGALFSFAVDGSEAGSFVLG
jgi:hypothetical protein